LKEATAPFKVLDEHVEITGGHISIGTMHLAQGLEFRAVALMACDDEIIPLQDRIETVGEDSDLQEVYDSERHLLYVASSSLFRFGDRLNRKRFFRPRGSSKWLVVPRAQSTGCS
jgi:superfamily I DNA/RNA helicase